MTICRGCGSADGPPAHIHGERKCCPECDHRPQQLPQPHEGIAGVDRAGDPLVDLDEAAATGVRAVVGYLVDVLHRTTLTGDHDSYRGDIRARMSAPRPGDLVLVLDSIYSRDLDTRVKGLGYLVEHRAEWWTTDEVYAAELLEDPTVERLVERHAFYVQYGPAPADVCRWVNCSVVAVPSVPEYLRATGARIPPREESTR